MLESLERREVLDYTVSFAASTLSIIADNGETSNLRITFDQANNRYLFTEQTANINFTLQGTIPGDVTLVNGQQLAVAASFFTGNQVAVDTGDNADIVRLETQRTGLSLDLGAGADSLFGSAAADSLSFANGVTFNGATVNRVEIFDALGGDDTVLGSAGDDVFTTQGANNYQLAVGGGNISLLNFEVVDGGSGIDTLLDRVTNNSEVTLLGNLRFRVDNGEFRNVDRFDGLENAGDNDRVLGLTTADNFTISPDNTIRTQGIIFSNMETFDGRGGSDTVVGTTGDDSFALTAANTLVFNGTGGVSINLISIENLDTGLGNDRVNVTAGPILNFTVPTNQTQTLTLLGVTLTQLETIFTGAAAGNKTVSFGTLESIQLGSLGRVLVNGVTIEDLNALAGIDTILGSNGNDQVRIDADETLRFGNIVFTGVKAFDGQGGSDLVQLVGGSNPLVVDLTGLADGSLTSAGIVLTQIETIDSNDRQVQILGASLAQTTGINKRVVANGIVFNNVDSVEAASTLQGSTGNDVVTVTANNTLEIDQTVFTDVTSFDGRAGTDRVVFNVPSSPNLTLIFKSAANGSVEAHEIDFANIEDADPTGKPILIEKEGDAANTGFVITGANAGRLNAITLTGITSLNNIDSVLGTTGDDLVTATLPNTINVAGMTIRNVQVFSGNGGNDVLNGPAGTAATPWRLSNQSIGQATITGFAAPGSLDNDGNEVPGTRFLDMDTIQSASANDTLFGTAGNDTFTIGTNSTDAAVTGDNLINTVRLIGFTTLDGAGGNDNFNFQTKGTFTGSIVGGDGTDTLRIVSADNHTFTINGENGNRISSRLTGTFGGVDSVVGGSGRDTFLYRATTLSRVSLDGGSPTTAGTVDPQNPEDVLDLTQATQGASLNFDGGTATIGVYDAFSFRNIESVIGTNFEDRFVRAGNTGGTRIMEGRGGRDFFQVDNNAIDFVVNGTEDLIVSFDDDLDVLTTPATPTSFLPTNPTNGTQNIFAALAGTGGGRFLNTNNFPLVADALVRHLYRTFFGGDPDSAVGQEIVAFWTRRVSTENLTSFDLVRAFLRTDVDPSPVRTAFFADHFFAGFAQQDLGLPFAGRNPAQLAQQAKAGRALETIARQAGFRISESTLVRSWVQEILVDGVSEAQLAALEALGSASPLIGPPSFATRQTLQIVGESSLRIGRPWLSVLETMANSESFLIAALRAATAEQPVLYGTILESANITSLKLGSFEQGNWFFDAPPGLLRSSGIPAVNFGLATDIPVPADYSGNGTDDLASFRNGIWFIDSNGTLGWQADDTAVLFGVPIDRPVPGDWNGTGRANLGVYRNGTWFIDTNRTFGWQGDDSAFLFGVAGDDPFVGDWNGDGIDDFGVRRSSSGFFYLDTNGIRGWQGNDTTIVDTWGEGVPVIADFDSDGRDEIAVVNVALNRWRIDVAGPLGWQPEHDIEIFFDVNGGVPIVSNLVRFVLTRLISAPPAETTGTQLFSGLDALAFTTSSSPPTADPAPTGSSTATSSTSGTNVLASLISNATASQPTRSRPQVGTDEGTALVARDDVWENWDDASLHDVEAVELADFIADVVLRSA
jgi:hypothetical protein